MEKRTKPFVGITLGDFNGIGPEIILKTISDQRLLSVCTPVLFASGRLMSKVRKALNAEHRQEAETAKEARPAQTEPPVTFNQVKVGEPLHGRKLNLVNCWDEDHDYTPGKPTPESGKCAVASILEAAKYLADGRIDAVVTAPIDKANAQSPDFNFPGHTEFFTSYFNTNQSLMLLVSGNLRVATLTGHVPLAEVAGRLNPALLKAKLEVLLATLQQDFGINKPRIAVLGLNPHAGENGLLGKEEQEILEPVIKEYRHKGALVYGPYPADGFFATGAYRKFDATLAMYHDQGLVPFKTLAFETGVNYTAGLPVIRTSPDHGTAYDIAARGIASESSLRHALFLACDIYKHRHLGM